MSHHPDHLGVDQLLRNRGSDLGIGLVVLGHQRELHRLAAELHFRLVRFVDGEARAVFIVLAQVRDLAGERAYVPDPDFLGGRRSRSLGCFRRLAVALGRGLLLLAAACKRKGSRNERDADVIFHANPPGGCAGRAK